MGHRAAPSGSVEAMASELFRMSDPDRLTFHDDMARGRDTRGLILRIIRAQNCGHP
jgi:hypothetical protein